MKNGKIKNRACETLSHEIVHKNPWYRIVHEKFITPKQTEGNYFVIEPHGTNHSVTIVPVIDGKIIFVKQYRYVWKKKQLELPTGGVEVGETPHKAAIKELMEETGYTTKKMQKIMTYIPWSGPLREKCTIFLATELMQGNCAREETELDMRVIAIDIEEVFRMIDAGKITDGMTLAALAVIRCHIDKK